MEGKTAVITGATSGIGAAYAARYAKDGCNLIITGRRKERIETFAEKLENEYKVDVEVVLGELSEDEDVQRLLEKISHRQVDILINNAGFGESSLFQSCELNVMEQMVKLNVLAPIKLIRAVLPSMVERGSGTIINISSESAFLSIPKNSVYSGCKSFLKSFTECLHLDLMNTRIKVQVLCPSFTKTDFHEKMGMDKSRQKNKGLIRWLSPDDVVDISLKALQKDKVVCKTGIHSKLIIWIMGLLPRRMYYKFVYSFSQKNFQDKTKHISEG